jgi:leucine-zipper of insertion element IS481
VDHHNLHQSWEALMVHRNAPLSETGRLRLARCVVEDGWPLRRAAERFQVSHTTAARWAGRYRQAGAAGMADRPSRPHASPRRTPVRTERRIIGLRVSRRPGPARIAGRLGLHASTVHAVLARYGCPPLAHLDRATGAPVRRYERSRPGELVHVDVKKLGNIPDGGGHRVHGRQAGKHNSQATTTAAGRTRSRKPILGYGYLHTALDDHTRLGLYRDPARRAQTDGRRVPDPRLRLVLRRRHHPRTRAQRHSSWVMSRKAARCPAGGVRLPGDRRLPAVVADRSEHARCVTSCLLITGRAGAPPRMARPVENPVTGSGPDPC